MGWDVIGTDLSRPMLCAAAERVGEETAGRLQLVLASMEKLRIQDWSADMVIAHGIWNLARSAAHFRQAVLEAARVAKPGAALFVFTFSRNTFARHRAVTAEPFVFTQFSGEPQCFLTETQLVAELRLAGFVPKRTLLSESNRPGPGVFRGGTAPAIYEGIFRRELAPRQFAAAIVALVSD